MTNGAWLVVVIAAFAVGAIALASPEAAYVWVRGGAGLLVAAWLVAAYGYGFVVRERLVPELAADDNRTGPLTMAIGVAALLAIDSFCASIGVFGGGRAWLAALPLALGIYLTVKSVKGRPDNFIASALADRRTLLFPGAAWLALPALAAFTIAAAVPPGLLWSTEFRGYDALSYHLQLPREWLAQGYAGPLQHNVYSALPSFVESATMNLFAIAGWQDVRATAVSAQMLHAALAVLAAWVTGAAAATLVEGPRAKAVAHAVCWCFVIGVPWMLVVGTLAYNEMGMLVCFAGALLLWSCGAGTARTGAALGVLLGAALGCKLTACGMVAAPVLAWMALAPRVAPGGRLATALRVLVPCVLVALAVLAPWLARNAIATAVTGGNPVFPFFTSIFGSGWWNADQVSRFADAHSAHGSLAERFSEFWYQGPAYGLGASPYRSEPWVPQWSVAWWIAGAALIALVFLRGRTALSVCGMLFVQLAFWLLATHMKSRFLLPCLVPMGMAVGAAVAQACVSARVSPWLNARPRAFTVSATVVACGALVLWCLQPLNILFYESAPRGSRANNPQLLGTLESCVELGFDWEVMCAGHPAVVEPLLNPPKSMPTPWALNHSLPPQSVVAAEGEAAPFWIRTTPLYGTVWDGGPIARALREVGDNPTQVIQRLRDQGVTHVLVDDNMLDVWNRSGWLDPAVTPGSLQSVRNRLRPLRPVISGVLYQMP